MKVWSCKIGETDSVPKGGDFPMREAVSRAYLEVTGEEPAFLFSGWGAELTESERAVVEDRLPAVPARRPEDQQYQKYMDALDRLARNPHLYTPQDKRDLAAVREAVVGWRLIAEDADGNLFVQRAESAEAELERLREGLRDLDAMTKDAAITYSTFCDKCIRNEAADIESLCSPMMTETIPLRQVIDALLAASPDGANTEGGEA